MVRGRSKAVSKAGKGKGKVSHDSSNDDEIISAATSEKMLNVVLLSLLICMDMSLVTTYAMVISGIANEMNRALGHLCAHIG